MVRMIRARRIRVNNSENDRLREQFIRQLTREAEAVLKQSLMQFTQEAQQQGQSILGALLGGDGPAQRRSSGGGSASVGNGLFNLVSTGLRYLWSRPQTSTNTQESQRSREALERFRVSQSQLMAEASASIAKGEKNL